MDRGDEHYLSDMARHNYLVHSVIRDVDFVPPSMRVSSGEAQLFVFEDNEAVIKMCIKGRSPQLRHVQRTHRVDLDWLFERIMFDEAIFIKYVGTKEQIADIFTKGSFNAATWQALLSLFSIKPHISEPIPPPTEDEQPPKTSVDTPEDSFSFTLAGA